jgi:hypothetical protein
VQNGRVPAELSTRWPASVTPGQALGYLLARHVPISRLPEGLRLVREAAGWLPPVGLHSPDLGMHQATVRSWMYAAREHALILGPPPGLSELLTVLGDGVIHSAARARSALEAAEAGELTNPRMLADFARWCGVDVPFVVLPPAARRYRPAEVIVPEADDLTRARRTVATLSRSSGLITVTRALHGLADKGIRVDAGNDAQAVRELLDSAGYSAWLWPKGEVATPLTTTLARIGTLPGPVPVEQIPAAVARTFQKRRPPLPGEWPLPVEAIRAWVRASPSWRLTTDDEIEPVGPRPAPEPHDELIRAVLSAPELPGPELPGPDLSGPQLSAPGVSAPEVSAPELPAARPSGKELNWTQLHRALKAAGLPSPTAGAVIRRSPLLRRTPDGYVLLGPEEST